MKRIEAAMREGFAGGPFIPYIQVHEFEAFVFVDLEQLPLEFPDENLEEAIASLRHSVGYFLPEEINDGEHTAPSKRLIAAIPAYKHVKAVVGPQIASRIGMSRLRQACPHFDAWVTFLEGLPNSTK